MTRKGLLAPIVPVMVIILLIAFLLRLWGINFGLPYRYHIDETQIVPPAARLCAGDLNMPPNYAGPNLQHLVLCGGDLALYAMGWLNHSWQSPADFVTSYKADPSAVLLIARLIHALMATATVLAVFSIGRILWDEYVGLIAAVILALTFLHVRESHFTSRDLFASFLAAISLLFCARAYKWQRLSDFFLCSLFGGLAMGVMWTMGLSIFPVVATMTLNYREHGVSKGLLSLASGKVVPATIAAFVLGFVLGYPNIVLRPSVAFDYLHILFGYAKQGELAAFQFDDWPGWAYYLKVLWWGTGPILTLLILVGFAFSLWRHSPADIIILVFAIPYYAVISSTSNYIGRYLIPVVPLLVLLVASWAKQFSGDLARRMAVSPRLILGILVPLIVVVPFGYSLRFDFLLTQIDTRTLAKDWIEANIPAGSKIAVDWPIHGPPIADPNEPQPKAERVYQVLVAQQTGLSEYTLSDYRRMGVDYLIASSNIYNIHLVDERRDAERNAFYGSLDQELTLVQQFEPNHGNSQLPFMIDDIYGPTASLWDRDRPGPTLKIYRVSGQ